ncbi:ribonuclease P protein subunit p25-like protein [Euwallacea fornicatus]|uniref:ribonuclease P protein subunit p25-like protein n=1 Tax=Euwallacea fornicatus TaxID=995702 RepID=UPI0033902B8F
MENYRKGKNVEEPMEKSKIPIPNLPNEFLWMQVRGGSKIRNLLDHAFKNFEQSKVVVWSGSGPSIGKSITCVEIMKREYKQQLHQINKICYTNVDEYWDPESLDLDQLVVKRKLPMVHICLSSEKLSDNELGYQAPSEVIPFRGQNMQKQPGNGRNLSRSSTSQRSTDNRMR